MLWSKNVKQFQIKLFYIIAYDKKDFDWINLSRITKLIDRVYPK